MRVSSATAAVILILRGLVSAAPATPSPGLPASAASTSLPSALTVDPVDFSTIQYYEQFAAAVSCGSNILGPNGPLICSGVGNNNADNCPDVQANNVVTTLKFANTSDTDTTGFVAVDNVKGLVVVSFRGMKTLKNVQAALNVGLVPLDICRNDPNCLGHGGFFQSWKEVRGMVIPAVEAAFAGNETLKALNRVVVAGHSLGGAIASIAALDLRNRGFNVDMASFGSPRSGNAIFASEAAAPQAGKQGRNFRVVHVGDIFPTLPDKAWPLGGLYSHILPEYVLADPPPVQDPLASRPLAPSDIAVNALDDDEFTVELLLAFVSDPQWGHGMYFNRIAGCGNVSVIDLVMQHLPEVKKICADVARQFPSKHLTFLNDYIQAMPNPQVFNVL